MRKPGRNGSLSLLIWLATSCALGAGDPVGDDANPLLVEPLRAFKAIPNEAREIIFSRGTTVFPPGGHFQGIQALDDAQRRRLVCFISRNSERVAYFAVVEFDATAQAAGSIRHLQVLPSDGRQPPLRHPGGMQLIGRYLVVGVEDNQEKRRSQVQFWDVSNPLAPALRAPLTVARESTTPKDKTAGAVGIVRRESDHLLVVANWDARALDFYTSNGLPLSDDACRFAPAARWSIEEAHTASWTPDRVWRSYQGVNLVCDTEFNLFLLGFATAGSNTDVIDLFSVDLSNEPPEIIRKLRSKPMQLTGGAHFRYAGGIRVGSVNDLTCYATERADRAMTSINVAP